MASGLLQQSTDMKATILLTSQAFCPRGFVQGHQSKFLPGLLQDSTLVDFDLMQLISLLQTQNVAYQLWQLMFVSPSGRKRITVSDAAKLGYSFNNTLSRVYLRAPYHSNESDVSVVSCRSQSDTELCWFHCLSRTSDLFFCLRPNRSVV